MIGPRVFLCATLCAFLGGTLSATPLPRAFHKTVPETLDDLRDIQNHVKALVPRLLPATVGLRIGSSQGSGVIVSKSGLVLTAAHVAGPPGLDVVVTLADGKTVKGKTLGSNLALDSGMVQITEPREWAFMEMGRSESLKPGNWVLTIGHPLGVQPGRAPVVRLSRVLEAYPHYIRSDGPLVGGDSGGPLFDMHGRVVGIHSRIGELLSANIQVPVDCYRQDWERLMKGETWGVSLFARTPTCYLGIRLGTDCKIEVVAGDSPAGKAGFRVDDVLRSLDGRKINSQEDLENVLRDRQPGDAVTAQLLRGGEIVVTRIILARRPG